MILLPGARSQRTDRRSAFAFAWDARDASLLPRTGQTPTLLQTGAPTLAGGFVVPETGPQIRAGKRMPRFGYDVLTDQNYLELSGTTAGQDVEQLTYGANLLAVDTTVLIRLTGLWVVGAAIPVQGGLFTLGTAPGLGAGALRLQRGGTNYVLTRHLGALNQTVNLAEPPALVWPADLLLTYTAATGIASLAIRSANGTITGPVTVGGASFIAPGRWGGGQLALGSDPAGGLPGAPARYYAASVALAIHTFVEMDSLR